MKTENILPLFTFLVLLISCKPKSYQNKLAKITMIEKVQPNVIVILIDDAGYIDFGFMGSEDLDTPRIDELAESGTIFKDAHVSATVCAPSRAGLLTGIYQQRFGFEANGTGGIGLSDAVVTMADVFKDHGYNTYALGKWHLGSAYSDQPNQRGFDQFYGFLAGSRSYFPIQNATEENMLQHNGERVVFEGYMTDVLGDQSIKYIQENGDKPFFMYLAYNAVHTPMEAKEKDLKKYNKHKRQKLAAMTWSLDENVGKLIDKLEDLNLRDNTLIYFLSDNGGAHNNQSKGGVLKGWKGNEYEGGHRVPFVVSYPKAFKGGNSFDGLTSSLDIFATSIAAAGIIKPSDLILDGVNLLPYLTQNKTGNPHDQLFWKKLDKSAVRIGDFKSITLEGYGSVMYNLKNNISETEDISQKNKVDFLRLQKAYFAWQAQMSKPLWGEGKDWENVCFYIHKQLMLNEKVLYKDIWSPIYLKDNNK